MIRTIIVDDEINAIKSLQLDLNHFSDVTILNSFQDPYEAISFIDCTQFDLLFLDIEMPEMDGFSLLQKLSNRNFQVVITTAYSNYAITAFKNNALDYLLKPFDLDELEKCLSKISTQQQSVNSVDLDLLITSLKGISNPKKIVLRYHGKLLFFEPYEITHAISDGNYSFIYFADGSKLHLTKKLKEVKEILFLPEFIRVHNSHIVNTSHIKSFDYSENYIQLDNNVNLPVSKSYKDQLLQKINYLFK